MFIDYKNIEKNAAKSVKIIENKGHARYIRYLLSKRVPPITIKKELARLALSAPDKTTLVNYFSSVIMPLVKKYNLVTYYKDYYRRLLKGDREKTISPILNFDITFEKNNPARIAFCALIRELEIEEMWSREITKFYGGIQNIPQDAHGNRIIKVSSRYTAENVLTCPKRYLIDKFLLEGVSPKRIVNYLLEKYQIKLNENDIYSYSKYFFNFERKSVEEMIEQLTAEQNSIKNDLNILDANNDYSLGDKLAISKQYQERVNILEENIKELNMKYSDLAYQQGVSEKLEIHSIIEDIIRRGYDRLRYLDRYKDRDVVKPLTDVAKMVFNAVDKMTQLEESKTRIEKTMADRDKNAQEVIMELYQQSYEEHVEKAEEKLKNGLPSEASAEEIKIEGLEEM